MKRTKRECLEGNGLMESGWFYCGVLMREFGGDDTGSFSLLDDAFGFVCIGRVVMLVGTLFGPGLLKFERGFGWFSLTAGVKTRKETAGLSMTKRFL